MIILILIKYVKPRYLDIDQLARQVMSRGESDRDMTVYDKSGGDS